jgi:hypothetical protein
MPNLHDRQGQFRLSARSLYLEETAMKATGSHQRTEELGRDVNGLQMVLCRDCNTCAHARSIDEARSDLQRAPCIADCGNCNALRESYDERPAVPKGGNCNTRLHVCPTDGRRWWQMNTHFHLWQQVTSDRDWEILNQPEPDSSGLPPFDGW